MELYGEDEVIEVKTKDSKTISLKLGDIKCEANRHLEENKISLHLFDFSGDIYGKNIKVYPKKKVSKEVLKNLFKISECFS